MPSNNFFKRLNPKRCNYQRQWGVQVEVPLLLEHVNLLFPPQESAFVGQ